MTDRTVSKAPLQRHLGRAFLHAAIIPLLLIELGFLGIYWMSSRNSSDQNVATVERMSREYFADVATREAEAVTARFEGISALTSLFARQTAEALVTPAPADPAERARYAYSPNGAFYTRRAGKDQAAVFFSGFVPVGAAEREKVWRTAPLDSVMRDIKASNPLVSQIYFNTPDSYNRIYPAFDVLGQYPARMNIPSYNFYYEADAAHNPERKAVWTDAYIDPAGSGWMVSSIAPAYQKDRLLAVAGIDVTVDTIIRRILDINLPWSGYAILVGRDGTILALPEAGERDLGLTELKGHEYAVAIKSDTFKPGHFNINKRSDLAPLAKAIRAHNLHHLPRGENVLEFNLGGKKMLATHAAIPGPGWHLVILAPADAILADATQLRRKLYAVGTAMILILLLFYILFFLFLSVRSRRMSRSIAEPLSELEGVMDRIGSGEYSQKGLESGIAEIDKVSEKLTLMGQRLGEAHGLIVRHEQASRRAYERERRITRGQRRFIDMLSYEFRTPLTVIGNCAQILRRRADKLTPEALAERAEMLQRATNRIDEVIDSANHLSHLEDRDETLRLARLDIGALVEKVAGVMAVHHPDIPLERKATSPCAAIEADPVMLESALAAVIENALRFSPPGCPVEIHYGQDKTETRIEIRDKGNGIHPDETDFVTDPFFRGSNSSTIPGAGVGLHLAATALELHGGSLTLESTPKKGTIVTLRLPILSSLSTDCMETA